MIKVGLYSSMFGKGDSPELETAEGFVDLARELRLDAIDFRSDVGFGSAGRGERQQLVDLKLRCHQAGLPIGYLASRGHFTGSEDELRAKIDFVAEDIERAALLGAPVIRVFCGEQPRSTGEQEAEVRCLRECCDIAADKGVIVGLQNHPCSGDNILRLLEQVDRANFTHILDTGQWTGCAAYGDPPGPAGDRVYRFMEQTAPYATHVRAKFFKIDSGREEWLDYERIVAILVEAGFNGIMGVVFEGRGVNSCGDREVIARAAAHLRELLEH